MHRIVKKEMQLYKKQKKYLCVARFLVFVMAAVCFVSMVSAGTMKVQAIGGIITGFETGSDPFWSGNGISVPKVSPFHNRLR